MSKYYTNVAVQGNNILFRGVKNGRRMKMKIQYAPTLFLPVKKPSEWQTLFGEPLEPMKFGDIKDAKELPMHQITQLCILYMIGIGLWVCGFRLLGFPFSS